MGVVFFGGLETQSVSNPRFKGVSNPLFQTLFQTLRDRPPRQTSATDPFHALFQTLFHTLFHTHFKPRFTIFVVSAWYIGDKISVCLPTVICSCGFILERACTAYCVWSIVIAFDSMTISRQVCFTAPSCSALCRVYVLLAVLCAMPVQCGGPPPQFKSFAANRFSEIPSFESRQCFKPVSSLFQTCFKPRALLATICPIWPSCTRQNKHGK